MNRITTFALALMLTIPFATACTEHFQISREKLPETALSFLDSHFPQIEILYIERDGLGYDVHFNNGWEVEFNHNGDWRQVDCRRDSVPASIRQLLPQKTTEYLETHFSNVAVVDIERYITGYELTLSNGIELNFSRSGDFRHVD